LETGCLSKDEPRIEDGKREALEMVFGGAALLEIPRPNEAPSIGVAPEAEALVGLIEESGGRIDWIGTDQTKQPAMTSIGILTGGGGSGSSETLAAEVSVLSDPAVSEAKPKAASVNDRALGEPGWTTKPMKEEGSFGGGPPGALLSFADGEPDWRRPSTMPAKSPTGDFGVGKTGVEPRASTVTGSNDRAAAVMGSWV
jgi:hypothetical protein